MTRYSVHRFRAAVLHMYLRIAAIISLPLSVVYFLFIPTPDEGLVLFTFGLSAFWLRWHTRHDNEESLRFANWVVLVFHVPDAVWHIHQHRTTAPGNVGDDFSHRLRPYCCAARTFCVDGGGAVCFATAVLMRPEPLTVTSAFALVTAYLTLGFVTLMLVRHNEQNIERLAHMSIIDPLTKAYNRGY